MEFIGSRGDKGIWMREHTLWKKTEIAILAYFSKNNNKPATYREIARAYVSSSYSNFQKACQELEKRGYLEKLESGAFKVQKRSWAMVKTGKEMVERDLPYFSVYLKRLEKRKNR